jgi:hypothetical protein
MPGNFLTNDMSKILKTTAFAVTATYDGTVVTGIFDDEDTEVVMGDGTIRIAHQCQFSGRTEDFDGIAENDILVIAGVTYNIRAWMDDGTGSIDIEMEKD